ncbi:CvpA family protein [Caldimonas brevitalea]|uniref:Colicin V synthesis protein n=1 Tax=Caldimonas brevitalea TaxID=413882 RepID=A0A0G3BG61_9BURK|nr:CvpA family protein [Caldimonas brevitalea]AKJ28287.1 colicin V synthesis protein [Caldimonas brevitalea]
MMMGLGWVDWALLALLLVSLVVGLWRGLVFEVLSVLGWVAAYVVAQWMTPQLAHSIPVGAPGSAVNHLVTFGLVFVGALFVWGLCAWLIKRLVQASVLSAADRVLGAGFGLVRGLLIALAVATLVAWTPLARSAAWQESHGARLLHRVIHGLKPLMPEVLARQLPA